MPSKRSHGEGTLRHRSDGRWELRMMDGYQKDGSPRFKTFYGKTQKEVKLKLKEYQDALISGVQLDTILYFEDWADTWFEGHRDNIAPTTQESYKYCLKMLKEGFYHRPLTVIRPIDIENFLKGMRRDGRSDSYISKARGMLYQIFQKAEANDLVRRNPVRLAEKMRASGTANSGRGGSQCAFGKRPLRKTGNESAEEQCGKHTTDNHGKQGRRQESQLARGDFGT